MTDRFAAWIDIVEIKVLISFVVYLLDQIRVR